MIEKDSVGNFIGKGENVAFDILRFIFNGKYIIDRQVKISTIFGIYSPKKYPKPSEEHLKSSIDIMMTKVRLKNLKFKTTKIIAIRELPGMTATEMQSVIVATGPALSDTIRAIISSHRARNDRSNKDKH